MFQNVHNISVMPIISQFLNGIALYNFFTFCLLPECGFGVNVQSHFDKVQKLFGFHAEN